MNCNVNIFGVEVCQRGMTYRLRTIAVKPSERSQPGQQFNFSPVRCISDLWPPEP